MVELCRLCGSRQRQRIIYVTGHTQTIGPSTTPQPTATATTTTTASTKKKAACRRYMKNNRREETNIIPNREKEQNYRSDKQMCKQLKQHKRFYCPAMAIKKNEREEKEIYSDQTR